jgi:hypothetical protein
MTDPVAVTTGHLTETAPAPAVGVAGVTGHLIGIVLAPAVGVAAVTTGHRIVTVLAPVAGVAVAVETVPATARALLAPVAGVAVAIGRRTVDPVVVMTGDRPVGAAVADSASIK